MEELLKKYPFIHSHIAKEPYVFDVLEEISRFQDNFILEGTGELASLDILKNSKNLKMPVSPARNKNILYLLELLVKSYPDQIKPVFSFDFIVDPETKKLTILQTTEFTIQISNDRFNRIQGDRDIKTIENLSVLLKKFRLFNLTKLIKKAQNKAYLSQVIKSEIGKSIFTFKNYYLDGNSVESSEDYCFHAVNYEQVDNSLKIDSIQKLVLMHIQAVNNRLKKYGIFNSDFSDFRDSKVDYILNILLNDINNIIGAKSLVEVKNFASLRECLIKVEKLIDPLIALNKDITSYIKEHSSCKWMDLVAVINGISLSMLAEWDEKYSEKSRIFSFGYATGEKFFMSAENYMLMLAAYNNEIVIDSGLFSTLSASEKQRKLLQLDLYASAGETLLLNKPKALIMLGNDENIQAVESMLEEYKNYKNLRKSIEKRPVSGLIIQKEPIIKRILKYFLGIFSRTETEVQEVSEVNERRSTARVKRRELSKDAVEIYRNIKAMNSPLIPLSDVIEILPENEIAINTVITELRANNLKIVIPIYKARMTLYPNRSSQYLMSDIEYLLVDPKVIESSESINDYLDDIKGRRLKDEKIPLSGFISIEKYLISLFKQKKTLDSMKKQAKS